MTPAQRQTSLLLLALAGFLVVVGWMLLNKKELPSIAASPIVHSNGQAFSGSASCQSCHRDLYKSHLQTAHNHTSQPASGSTIEGSFEVGKNSFSFGPDAKVMAERRVDGLYQVGYVNGQEAMAQRFDVVIGSGRKGQTYLFWHNDRLFQLPMSYYAPTKSWSNSPGYPPDQILFNRPVAGRCLECHATFAQKTSLGPPIETFDRQQMLLGIACERCHGPAARHVSFHSAYPGYKGARYIINAATLPRQQRLDACALCHSGLRRELKPAFLFITGDKLSDYSQPDYSADSLTNLDVHGNQYGLLMASKCFQQSPNMDCSSCHNIHATERNNPALFSQRCIACHTADKDCELAAQLGPKIRQNCIDCHMPLVQSRQLTVLIEGQKKSIPNVVRTHRVSIYMKPSRALISYLQSFKQSDTTSQQAKSRTL